MGDFGWEGGIGRAFCLAPRPRRFAPAHRRGRPGGPALARLGPPGRSIRLHAFNHLYISRGIGLAFRPGVLPPSSCKPRFPYCWRFLIRLRQTPREGGVASRKKNGRLRARPPSARAIPSATAPSRFSMSEGFHHFDIEEAKARPLFECSSISTASDPTYVCRSTPGLVLKPKKKRAADAALFFLNRYIWRQSYASLKNFFLPT